MADQIENSIYDDDEAVRFIQSHVPQEIQGKYTDDEVLLISDTVYDFFERNGWLDSDEEVDLDVDEIVNFVIAQCKKDKECHFDLNPEYISWVVEAELDYEESLG